MRCLSDTKIVISAALFPSSVPAQAFMKALASPNSPVVCDYSIDEMRRVFNRKFPHKLFDFEHFLSALVLSVEIVTTPLEGTEGSGNEENRIRDVNDRPVYRAALFAKVDYILTGDKDFLDAGVMSTNAIYCVLFRFYTILFEIINYFLNIISFHSHQIALFSA